MNEDKKDSKKTKDDEWVDWAERRLLEVIFGEPTNPPAGKNPMKESNKKRNNKQ